MRKTARILFLTLFAFCLSLSATTASFAQSASSSSESPILNELFSNTDASVTRDIGGITQVVTVEFLGTINCLLTGINPVAPTRGCLGVNNTTGKLSYQKPTDSTGGLISGLGTMIAMTYTPPASTGMYVNYLAENFGVSKKAYAQNYPNGVGFAGIAPLFNLWKAFRDIVYMIFVGVFVFIGLAIMLRVKIDPRTVMTVENQIPKLIIGIVLVTLSFPIAGFLIDFMYLLCYLIMNVLAGVDQTGALAKQLKDIQSALYEPPIGVVQQFWDSWPVPFVGDVFKGFLGMILVPSIAVSKLINQLILGAPFINGALNTLLAFLPGQFLCLIPPIGSIDFGSTPMCQIGANGISGLVGIVVLLILFFALAWTLFRLWFQLIMAYVLILLDIIFAPFWVLGGMLPGEGTFNFGGWIREMLSHLISFPAALTMLLLAKILTDESIKASGQLFVPPLVGNPGDVNLMGSLVGLGIIFLTPQVVVIMKDILKAPQFKYISAVGQPVAAGQKVAIGGTKDTIGLGMETMHGSMKPGDKGWKVIAHRLGMG